MTLPQHLVPSLADVRAGDVVEVTGDEAHHAVVVRRLRVGEPVQLCDGAGRVVTGEVSETGKRQLDVTVREVVDHPEPAPSFTVVQALPKGERGELAVEVLTEIGAARIVPWAAARSVAVWKGERAAKAHAKWQATAREAAKQSRRAWHPQVPPLARTAQVLDLVAAADLAIVLHEEASASLASLPVPATGEVLVVVGPEGGLSPEEVADLTAAGAVAVGLGAEVLRTSTAGVAALAALLSRTSRWA
ncbi:16S rRNA (uracil(1498)-N(3))-methyltransferase [Nocardioides sp. zg-536]|uniref:Ribosomal RNA small subunit methyltransferase E n=1 Tax=Nocardioides faecalis TaxID=2803858 RepID=A0A938Y1Q4_9ACTN|nr:16S rRNA (uracil(1498)-N(3))-methyltransferase [Nocardioides faecalis]MBM9460306.1 16S rRNA (uracil(1498)-N(3))-methyltransferase [Nocardioides faecalis]MBS4751231.1 16S rRNA (uracil(1498)-N(3))-methyltransferase [Nocardioides faecalis]QVI59860.1 16S rRNA (uracil(1498)-N(3))-methyltransferase [Nocardioides faecalis]